MCDRRAKKQIVAVMKGSVDGWTDLIDDLFFTGKLQRGGIDIVCNQPGHGEMMSDGFGNGAADQSQADKTTGQSTHLCDYLSYSLWINPFLL